MAQPLMLSLDLLFPLTEMTQSVDVSGHPGIPYGFNGSRHHVIHLEVFSQQVQVVSSISRGNLRPGFGMEYIAKDGSAPSHG